MLELIVSVCLFGTIGVFIRCIPLPSGIIAMARGLVGTLFLLIVIRFRKSKLSMPDIRRNLPLLCLSGACLGGNWILLFEAYRYTTVAKATLCYYLAPILVTLVSPLFFHERLSVKKGVCAALALGGMVLVSGIAGGAAGQSADLRGILFGLCAAVLYAGVIITTKRLKGISACDGTAVQLAISAIVIAPYTIFAERLFTQSFTLSALLLLALVGVVHTGLSYMLYFDAVKRLSAQTVAILSYIDPVVAILASAMIFKEPLRAAGILGAILVLGSALVSELPERGARRKP